MITPSIQIKVLTFGGPILLAMPYLVLQVSRMRWRDVQFGGSGRVAGTVKEKASPANLPWGRRVLLLQERTGYWVQSTWSDPVTGAYSFDWVDMTHTYTVISYDHTGAYRAVIADGQTPELMP